ncbi:MAG: YlmH/Sll1252 family protein [Clostridia bacterium]|jgi:RNA-binding protein YlmH|nr:YlmH/Sll1252 family protein [Clostridia bacterium]MCI2001024.1 YlmH/Sll1252 family protein [Clostridia bacterium]MCI2015623.1 YlmH/Sll1252 family protein [Clostridia bacterium]
MSAGQEKNCKAENKILIASICDRARLCEKKHENTFTDFCSPTEMEDVYNAASAFREVKFKAFGGNENCERRVGCFYYEYTEPSESDFPLKAIKITNNKFSTEVSHRDYLGSVLGLGIDRAKVGDIFVFDGSAIMFIKNEIAEYVNTNLERVGKNTVKTQLYDIFNCDIPDAKTEDKRITVSSLRLDTLVGAAFNISRGKARNLIVGEKVAVDWIRVTNPSKNINEGSMLSVRGFGRAKLMELTGVTKKERIAVVMRKFI